MIVLIDTNILVSALLRPDGNSSQVLKHVSENHQLILSDFNISELREVTRRKFPQKAEAVDVLLGTLSYDIVRAPLSPDKRIGDPKDAPILNAAIEASVDVIVSGDTHFQNLALKKPEIIFPAEYIDRYFAN